MKAYYFLLLITVILTVFSCEMRYNLTENLNEVPAVSEETGLSDDISPIPDESIEYPFSLSGFIQSDKSKLLKDIQVSVQLLINDTIMNSKITQFTTLNDGSYQFSFNLKLSSSQLNNAKLMLVAEDIDNQRIGGMFNKKQHVLVVISDLINDGNQFTKNDISITMQQN